MSFQVHRSDKARHLVLRASGGDLVPDALVEKLREEGVACGWLRASGVLADVELRAYDPQIGGLAAARLIGGPVQALSIEGSIGLVDGEAQCSMRAVLARESDRGLEAMAGEIQNAHAIALEIFVTSLDDLELVRSFDETAGVWILGVAWAAGSAPRPAHPAPRPAQGGGAPRAWSSAIEASADAEHEPSHRAAASPQALQASHMPRRPARPVPGGTDLDSPVPEAGDAVDHFAFGRCDVLKSDGDRLHLKVHKDGRIREIALEMLRVVAIEGGDETSHRRFKLERRI